MSVGVLTVLTMCYVPCTGLTSPNAIVGAIGVEPEHAGAASGLYGFAQMTYGALCTAIIAPEFARDRRARGTAAAN